MARDRQLAQLARCIAVHRQRSHVVGGHALQQGVDALAAPHRFDDGAIGNLLAKSDVGGYGYGSRPHAVQSAAGLACEHDANGSIIEARAPGASSVQGRVRQITWTAFNQPQESH